ncbi:MAG: DUF2442 domain-containing protein [Alphaproteobacteria bacterium]|nr:DUF2442 domain-containing protein [Alphaproteobacteria bacterium]
MPLSVREVSYLDGYRLKMSFSNGDEGVADLSQIVKSAPGAEPLNDLAEFKRVGLDEWPTVVWPCGFALAPEYAYRLATGKAMSWEDGSKPRAA